jgi:acetate---CoA ligase (ADP-forming)
LKVESPTLVHKTEAGAVELDVGDANALEWGYERLRGLDVADMRGILVQEMVPPGTEVILGMTRDAQFGPVIAIGLGGIFVEFLEDVQLLVPPVGEREVRAALERLRGIGILHGARGQAPRDIRALVDTVLRFSDLCLDLAGVVDEIDINPLVVLPHGVRAVDCLIVPSTREVGVPHGAA